VGPVSASDWDQAARAPHRQRPLLCAGGDCGDRWEPGGAGEHCCPLLAVLPAGIDWRRRRVGVEPQTLALRRVYCAEGTYPVARPPLLASAAWILHEAHALVPAAGASEAAYLKEVVMP
jgi:hypothetical protein